MDFSRLWRRRLRLELAGAKEPKLPKVTDLAAVLRLHRGCCISLQSVSKSVSAHSPVFSSRFFPMKNFLVPLLSVWGAGGFPWCCRAAFSEAEAEKVLFPGSLTMSSSSSVKRQQDGSTYQNNFVVFLVLFEWQKCKKRWDGQVVRPEIMPKSERSGNLCTIGRTVF